MKNTKKSLLLSVVSMLLCFSMLLGTSWAWFTDSVSSGSNVIKSGNLDLDVQYTLDGKTWNDLDGADDLFQKGLWEPGHTEVVALKITNKGSLALKYEASMNIIKESIGKNKDGGSIVLSEILTVSTLTFAEAGVDPLFGFNIAERSIEEAFKGENNLAYNAPVAFKAGNILQDDNQLLPGEAHYVVVKVDMPEKVGNEANHDGVNIPTIEFGVNVLATQYAYESDSFDNQYDKDATFEDLADTNVLASSTKTLSEGADSIDFALYSKGIRIAKLTVPASAIADTTKPVKVIIDGIDPSEEAMVDESTQAYAYDIKVTNLKSGLTGDQLVTVVVAAPNALAAMKAYHNGELIEDAVYDEVAGTITFKTASFSPFDFTSNVEEVETLDELRAALQKDGTTAKLIDNIIVDLTKGSDAARVDAHAYVGTNNTYYNGVMINGKEVGLDLNGHSITAFCGNDHIGNSDVGALFFVGKEGSLNITNTGAVQTGFIKMASSIYAVWAPFADPSYVDIYGGAFIGDSYAGDPIGTSTAPDSFDGTMQNENSNRALIYAGFGGNINVYGGYFLYNNTPNDLKNRNNGAFNAKDFYSEEEANEKGPLITIHDGVMLINKEYRQNPQYTSQPNGDYDNFSVVLAEDHVINEVNLDSPVVIVIDGEEEEYSTWYEVQRTYYNLIFMSNDGGKELAKVKIPFTQGEVNVAEEYTKANGPTITNFSHWVNTGAVKTDTILANNTKDVTLYAALENIFTARYVDEAGNVLATVQFTQKSNLSVIEGAKPKENPKSASEYLEFNHWEVKNADGTHTDLGSYKPSNAKGDITIYPYFNIKDGGLGLTPVDVEGDGDIDYYTVEAVDASNLGTDVEIPGMINGIPVKTITDLSGNWATNTQNIIVKEGVEEIKAEAFAGTTSLQTVELPSTIIKIEKNAFYDSSVIGNIGNLVGFEKKPTIIYNGTKTDWDKVCANSEGWETGLSSGTKVICNDGVYTLTRSGGSWGGNYTYTWTWAAN